ncbi:MAG: sialate O-acetylesterase [Mariniblastus sp.]
MTAVNAMADISMPKIFADHMVLQRNATVEIWGTAEPQQRLSIKFGESEQKTTAGTNGNWSVKIATPEAGGPFQLEVVAEAGEPKIIFSDVMVGDVWVCAGQCNMAMPVSDVLNGETEIGNSKDFPMLRMFTISQAARATPLDEFTKVEPWSSSPDTVKDFSATAYFFGREVSKKLKGVPIGLIDASWEKTTCETWISRDSLKANKSFDSLLKHWDEIDEATSSDSPSNIFNGMLAPLKRFPVRGTIWYQGAANNGRGALYAKLLPTLIDDWRKHFGNPKMPFYFVQPTPFRHEGKPADGLAEIWAAQVETLKKTKDTGMVVTTDIGKLTAELPKNKQEVGRRLALIALANVYEPELDKEQKITSFSGPIFQSFSTNEREVRLTFSQANGGLKIQGDKKELSCFTICGEDKNFVPATARIEGDILFVSSPDITNPIAVRFAWDDTAQPNLVNADGLPASPFRTDSFPLPSEGRDF